MPPDPVTARAAPASGTPAVGTPAAGTPAAGTLAAALREATAVLARAGIDTPRLDARLLLAAAAGVDALAVLTRGEAPLEPAPAGRFADHVRRRAAREPVSRILGRREFHGLDLRIGAAVLDPRPDSETVVGAALARLPDRDAPLRLLDPGTGSGCLLLALLAALPRASGLGVDVSPGAVRLARENARRTGLADRAEFLTGSWERLPGPAAHGSFNLLVTNPPYIADTAIAGLDPEVALYDPETALSGGADGLDAIRSLAPRIRILLAPGGTAVMETGADQTEAATRILAASGLVVRSVERDLAGRPRCLVAGLTGDGNAPQ